MIVHIVLFVDSTIQMLLGASRYDFSVDMWAIGCILFELLANVPLFPGGTDIEQIARITAALGPFEWPGSASLPDAGKIIIDAPEEPSLPNTLAHFPAEAADLITKLLVLNPTKRLTAQQALKHPFLTSLPLPSLTIRLKDNE